MVEPAAPELGASSPVTTISTVVSADTSLAMVTVAVLTEKVQGSPVELVHAENSVAVQEAVSMAVILPVAGILCWRGIRMVMEVSTLVGPRRLQLEVLTVSPGSSVFCEIVNRFKPVFEAGLA